MDDSFEFMSHEKELRNLQSDNNKLTLTSRRVRDDYSGWGRTYVTSITLDAVASCGVKTRSYPLLLIFGFIIFLVGPLFLYDDSVGNCYFCGLLGQRPTLRIIISALIGLALMVAYMLLREAVISVHSNGGEAIHFPTKGLSRSQIVGFVNDLEKAKLKSKPD